MAWLSWLVLASALVAMGADLAYMILFPRGNKWALRFIDALAVAYFGVLYLLMGLEQFDTHIDPELVRPGILLLLLLLAAEPIYDIVRRGPPAR